MRKQRGRLFFLIKLGNGKIEPSLRFSGFTLIELSVVIIIIGIMVAYAMPQFAVTKERALDREAKASLALLRAAERIYKMEAGKYYPFTGSIATISDINTNLKLSLSTGDPNWAYSVDNTSGTGTIQGIRSAGAWIRTWTWNSSDPSDDIPSSACTPAAKCPP